MFVVVNVDLFRQILSNDPGRNHFRVNGASGHFQPGNLLESCDFVS